MSLIGKVSKSIFNYYLMSSLIGAFFSFIIVIFLSHKLNTEGFVAIGVFSALIGIMPSIIGFHTRSFFLIESVKFETLTPADISNISSCFFWMLISLLALLIFGSIFDFGEFITAGAWELLIISAFMQWLYYMSLVIAQSKKNAKLYFTLVVASSATGVLFVVAKWWLVGVVWEDRVYGLWAGFFVAFCVFSVKTKGVPWWKATFQRATILKSFKYSIFLVPFSLSVSAVAFFDRYVVSKYIGIDIAAQYISISQFVLVYAIFSDSIYKKTAPLYLKNGDFNVLLHAALSSLVAVVIFLLIGEFVFYIVFPATITFDNTLYLLMLMGAFAVMLVKIVSLIFNYYGRNKHLATYAVLFNLVCVLLMFSYINSLMLGVYVIPLAIIASNLLMLLALLIHYKGMIK